MDLTTQLTGLFLLAMPVACIAWTVTHEEFFREPREYCLRWSETARSVLRRKFFYVFTCEYCFSFYVTVLLLFITHFKLLYPDWRGYLISFFCLVWVANFYMSIFFKIRIEIKKEGIEAKVVASKNDEVKKE